MRTHWEVVVEVVGERLKALRPANGLSVGPVRFLVVDGFHERSARGDDGGRPLYAHEASVGGAHYQHRQIQHKPSLTSIRATHE